MSVEPGSSFGHYEIVSLLGVGGMGAVYRARDPRLGRDVAVKILHPEAVEDAERRQRFEREARAASALNHPNITAVFDVGSADGMPFIVFELVEGRSLTEVIEAGNIPNRRLLDIACQLADGLAAAHTEGVVHRDLKPDNVKITPEGRVKILDFGLARDAGGALHSEHDDTRTQLETQPGMLMGTVSYMSPEQARGEPADHRSDQFACGLVLYELAAGRPAFTADTMAEMLVAILKDEPQPIGLFNASVPAPFQWIVERCLSKEAHQRYASTTDLFHDLRNIRGRLTEVAPTAIVPAPATEPATPPSRQSRPVLVLAPAALVVGFILGYLLLPREPVNLSSYQFTPIAAEAYNEAMPAVSPDGRSLAYAAGVDGIWQILIRSLDSPTPVQLTNRAAHSIRPHFSPDGRSVYFDHENELQAVSVTGGQPRTIVEDGIHGRLSPDGATLLFYRPQEGGHSLWQASPDGSNVKPVEAEGFPVEMRVIKTAGFTAEGTKYGVLLMNLDRENPQAEFWTIAWPEARAAKSPIDASQIALFGLGGWMPDGRGLLASNGNHLVIMDTFSGAERSVAAVPSYIGDSAITPNGEMIAFDVGGPDGDLLEMTVDGSRVSELLASSRDENNPAWLPDGDQLVYASNSGGNYQIYIRQRGRSWAEPVNLADLSDPPENVHRVAPTVSPDGTRIAYQLADPRLSVWVAPVRGGPAVRPDAEGTTQRDQSWSSDGAWIVYSRHLGNRRQLARAPSDGSGVAVVIKELSRDTGNTAWAPSVDWIAYSDTEGLHLISPEGDQDHLVDQHPTEVFCFAADGRSLFTIRRGENRKWELARLRVPDGRLLSVSPLDLPVAANLDGFHLHPDGTRFVLSMRVLNYDIWLLDGFDL